MSSAVPHTDDGRSVAISLEESLESDTSSSTITTSRLLCPSNLGALLESTTATLVSKPWTDSGFRTVEENKVPVAPSEKDKDSNYRYITSQQLADRESEDSSEVHEIVLPLDFQPSPTDKLSPPPRPPSSDYFSLPVLISPIPLQQTPPPQTTQSPSLMTSTTPPLVSSPQASPTFSPSVPSSATSPLSLSHPASVPPLLQAGGPSTVAETHGSCYSSDLDLRRQHQLCIPIDEGSAVMYTPPLYYSHSAGSQRSSVCSAAPSGEGENPGTVVRHEVKTHSRNVSETPSLPPFYSSSTSSAYHSRNSSLGSQMSSCFESDSMLNQLTDIDSCLAVHTGSNTDLKQHVKLLQDSRFSHRGDSSPSSCSSDLNLHHHMTKPLEPKDTIVTISPLNLEETLRNLSLEKVEDYKKKLSMKSSEWIKREVDCHGDSLVMVKVSSKSKHVVHFNVKAGDIIIWEFATKKKDIAFGVSFEATEVAMEQSPLPDSHESLDQKMSAILPIFRVSTHAHPTIGTHTASLDGIYEITFDNTYSRFFAKELYYRITTQPSQPNAHYLEQ